MCVCVRACVRVCVCVCVCVYVTGSAKTLHVSMNFDPFLEI